MQSYVALSGFAVMRCIIPFPFSFMNFPLQVKLEVFVLLFSDNISIMVRAHPRVFWNAVCNFPAGNFGTFKHFPVVKCHAIKK